MAENGATATAGEGGTRRFLTFRVDERLYAVPADEVREVVRVPPLARVPQAPGSLLGVANLRGAVLPVASLRGLLGREEEIYDSGARAIVLDLAAPVAFVVDRVEALVAVAAHRVETGQATLATEGGERLQGAFQGGDDGEATKILDVRGLIAASFVPRERNRPGLGAGARAAGPAAAEGSAEHPRLVTFEVAGQDYALPLEAVQEIVPAPPAAAAVPGAEALVLGVAAYRNSLLPLLSLRGLLGFPAGGEGPRKVVVVRVRGALVGLVADRMRAVVPADPALVEPVPAVLAARAGGEARIGAVYKGEGGRLVSILAPERLFREDVMQRLGTGQEPARGSGDREGGAGDSPESRFLAFRLGDEEFGLPIEAVDEVARLPDRITRVPGTPAFLEGVANLRGEVLPVVDQRRRFGLPASDAAESRRLVVVRTGRLRAGVIVDGVSGILAAPGEAIEPAPDLTGEPTRLVVGVLSPEGTGRIVLLLDPAELLTRAERGQLDSFSEASAP